MSSSLFTQNLLPRFKNIEIDKIEVILKDQLQKNRQEIANLLASPSRYTWDGLMNPLEKMGDDLNKLWSPIAHMHAVMESDALREVYNVGIILLSEYQSEFSLNENLYLAILSIANGPEFEKLNAAQQKIIENDLRDFRLAGVNLSSDKKEKLRELHKKLSQLMTKFSENLLDATQAWSLPIIDEKKLKGLPKQALQLVKDHAKQRGLEGHLLTLDHPTYSAAIKFLEDRELRRELYTAYATRASDQGPNKGQWDNTPIMENILEIRHEIAQSVGFANYAEYSLATKMARSPQEVMGFLQDLLIKSRPIAEKEYEEIVALAKKDGITDLQMWDISFYSEKLQKSKFDFTQEDFRPYFPVQKVLNGMFMLVNKLYGIHVREEMDVETWREDVKFFSIFDEENELRGGLYIDLYARVHKREGAWMDECRARHMNGAELQRPIAYLTCNFMPPINDQSALLTHDDVLTLFHEFGHCLHHVLTKVDYPSVAGINGVLWDAVEFPSQFMENYCWDKGSLDMIAGHYETGKPLPEDLYKKMMAAKHFQTGLQMIRQLEFSLFDFRLHLEYNPTKKDQVRSVLDSVREKTALVSVPEFNRFQHSFSHIFAGSYAAGYYSYKWAEVLSSDAFAQFEEKGIFDRETGQAFMKNILEIGGVKDPMTAFIAFRGRRPTIDALLRQSGIIE